VAAACAARGVRRQLAAVSEVGNSAVAVATGALSERAPGAVGLSAQHCSTGPGPILCTVTFCNYSNFDQISKYKLKAILMSKIIETCHGARVDHSKQFLPLGPLPMLNIIQVIKLGTTPL
jgi:hypothetical protein